MCTLLDGQELSLELCGVDTDDPIVSIAAVNAQVLIQLLPDDQQTRAYMTLHDLVCDDRRVGACGRTFRRMVGRAGAGKYHHSTSRSSRNDDEDVFQVNYTKNTEDQSRLIGLFYYIWFLLSPNNESFERLTEHLKNISCPMNRGQAWLVTSCCTPRCHH